MRRVIGALKWLLGLAPDRDPGGFGQSLLDELRFLVRFRRCRAIVTTWRPPSQPEQLAWAAHPIVGRFGDDTVALAEADGRIWIVRDRDWYGWPDPPRFVFFALQDGTIWCAKDFHDWPGAWSGVTPG